MSLFSLFKKQPQRALGVSLDDQSIRWSVVSITSTGYTIEAHGTLDLGYPLWEQIASLSKESKERMIRDSAPVSAYAHLPLACVLPESFTQTVYITVDHDRDDSQERTQDIERAIESYIVEHPIYIVTDTVCLYDIIEAKEYSTKIIITLYRAGDTHPVREIFTQLGFSDISFTPMHDALHALYHDPSPTLLFSIARTHTSLFQLHEGRLQSLARVPFGIQNILDPIRDVVGKDRTQRVYMRYGMKPTHRDQSLYQRITQQALPLIEYAQSMVKMSGTDHALVITGEYADIPGFDMFLARHLRRTPTFLAVQQRFVSPEIRLPAIDARDMLRFAPSLGAAIDYLESR